MIQSGVPHAARSGGTQRTHLRSICRAGLLFGGPRHARLESHARAVPRELPRKSGPGLQHWVAPLEAVGHRSAGPGIIAHGHLHRAWVFRTHDRRWGGRAAAPRASQRIAHHSAVANVANGAAASQRAHGRIKTAAFPWKARMRTAGTRCRRAELVALKSPQAKKEGEKSADNSRSYRSAVRRSRHARPRGGDAGCCAARRIRPCTRRHRQPSGGCRCCCHRSVSRRGCGGASS